MSEIFLTTVLHAGNSRRGRYQVWHPPPMGLGYISAVLREAGFTVKVFDLWFHSWHLFFEEVKRVKPFLIGIQILSEEFDIAKWMIAQLEKLDTWGLIVIAGGAHPTALPQDTLTSIPGIDYIALGEGENTLLELANCIKQGPLTDEILAHIKGIGFRNRSHEIILTEPRPRMTDLNHLPFPAWDLFPLSYYSGYMVGRKSGYLELPIITMRGCPNNCIFCQNLLGHQVALRDIKSVLDEIDWLIEKFHVTQIFFIDPTFTLFRDRIIELCKGMITRGHPKKIHWLCYTRVDKIDYQLLRYMRLAGCRAISYGIESGNARMLKRIQKNIEIPQIYEALRLTRKVGITSEGCMIIGFPNENSKSLTDSINMAIKSDADIMGFGILIPYPGTEIYRMAKMGNGGLRYIARAWADFDRMLGRTVELKNISHDKLKLWQFYAHARFFLNPRRIFKFRHLVNPESIPLFFGAVIQSFFQLLKKKQIN